MKDIGQEKKPKEQENILWKALEANKLEVVEEIFAKWPQLNSNCVDDNELTPLQHACHRGNPQMVKLLLKNHADVNFTSRKDGYTSLMFAAIGGHAEIVKILLEQGADTSMTNCVNRNASEMAAFVSQYNTVSTIAFWEPYSTVKHFTKPRELETKPRIPSEELGKILHGYITLPTVHPIKLIIYMKNNLEMLSNFDTLLYVLENISSRAIQPPRQDQSASLRFHYLASILKYCHKHIKDQTEKEHKTEFDSNFKITTLDKLLRKLASKKNDSERQMESIELQKLIVDSLMKFPYTNSEIFKTYGFAFSKIGFNVGPLSMLKQLLNGPIFSLPESCQLCGEINRNKKCGKCMKVFYCSRDCQKVDWYQHKRYCKSGDQPKI